MEQNPAIKVGAVTMEREGESVVIRSARQPQLSVSVPVKVLEAWALRKMRDEVLQPEKTT